jgi:EmrB/QacA subfamily drug resistance transporter
MPNQGGTRAQDLLRRRQAPDWLILALACVAQFMVILDVSVVNVALPSIGRDLHYSPVGLQWVVNAYVLTFAGFLLLGGRAADSFGRRKIFLAGLVVFAGTSLVGGFAQSSGWLTAARAIQGIGGAALSPATLTIIITTFSGRELARALGLWSAVGGAGGAIGVLLGGVLTAELSWRWVLFINVPIGIAAAFVAIIFLGEAKGTGPRQRLDLPGAITVTAGLAALVYAIVGTDQYAWGSAHTLICLVAAAVLLAVFFVLQQRGRSPLMPLRLFRIRGVTGANIVIFLVGAVFFSMWYFLSLYLQDVLGYGALRAGLAFLPMGIAIIIGAQATSRAMPRTGIRPLLLGGTLLVSAGFFGLSQIGPGSHYWGAVFGPGVVVSLALGVLFTPLAAAATAGVDRSEAGLASGLLNTSRQIGGSLGLAILATLASTHIHALEGTGVAAGHALADGFARAFLVGGFVGIAAFVAAFVVPGHTGTSKSTTTSYPATVPASTLDGDPAVLPVTMPAETSSSGTG